MNVDKKKHTKPQSDNKYSHHSKLFQTLTTVEIYKIIVEQLRSIESFLQMHLELNLELNSAYKKPHLSRFSHIVGKKNCDKPFQFSQLNNRNSRASKIRCPNELLN